MKLLCRKVDAWPKLAWVAKCPHGSDTIQLLHGPMVETRDDWAVEAVWAGDFAKGDFDQTDLVFGTGVRLRDDSVIFVSAGTTLDRLWHTDDETTIFVSNSLPALLSVAGLKLDEAYTGYGTDVYAVARGLDEYPRELPGVPHPLGLSYHDNLVLSGSVLQPVHKPVPDRRFETFGDYEHFLRATTDALRANMKHPDRRFDVEPVVGVSSGYDSAAVAVLAKRAGCTYAVSLRKSTSLWRGSDSGEPVAKALGMNCACYDYSPRRVRHEEAFWAVSGRPADMGYGVMEYPKPLACFFSGDHGDKMWGAKADEDLSNPWCNTGFSGRGIAEFRLHEGFFNCVVPCWGFDRAADLREISRSSEMDPWRVGGDYDRPIPRRIAEEAGVPRAVFGQRKKNTQTVEYYLWPYSPSAFAGFRRFLAERSVRSPSRVWVQICRVAALCDHLLARNLTRKLGFDLNLRSHLRTRAQGLTFQWANDTLASDYAETLIA